MLQLENLCSLGTENFTALLPDMTLMGVAGTSGSGRRRWCSVDSTLLPLLGRPGLSCFLKMMDVCLDVVNVSEDCSPMSG